MTANSMTLEDAMGELRPHLSEDFLRTWRRVTLALGYRQVGKALSGIAPKGKTARIKAQSVAEAKRELSDDELDDLQSLEEKRLAIECWFAEYPAFDKVPLRTVSRFRKRTGLLARGMYQSMVEQIAVNADVAAHLKTQGVAVEYDKRHDTYYADCEDQAWGQDVYLEEWFGAKAGTEGHTFDDLLPAFRKALALKVELPRLENRMREIEEVAA